MMESEIIENIDVIKRKCTLKKPYVLSFTTLYYLTSIEVRLSINKRQFLAEVVPLLGYSPESEKSIYDYLINKIDSLTGLPISQARAIIEKDIPQQPFATSPLLTAMDMAILQFSGSTNTDSVDFVIPSSTTNIPELEELSNIVIQNKSTLKVKLSGNLNVDCNALDFIDKNFIFLPNSIRLDANQAYTIATANSLYKFLSNKDINNAITYVEQPLKIDNWNGHAELINTHSEVNTMLDESVVTLNDVHKSIKIGAPFIKLKLFKQGGIKELISLSHVAYENNVKVVMGNGVATDISNKIEINVFQTYSKYFFGASEANGFQKIKSKTFE